MFLHKKDFLMFSNTLIIACYIFPNIICASQVFEEKNYKKDVKTIIFNSNIKFYFLKKVKCSFSNLTFLFQFDATIPL